MSTRHVRRFGDAAPHAGGFARWFTCSVFSLCLERAKARWARPLLARIEHDLRAIVVLVVPHLVGLAGALERPAMADDEARIDATVLDHGEQRAQYAMHVGLAHPNRQRLREGAAH